LLLSLVVSSVEAATVESWAQIRERGVLRVGTPGDYAPYALWRDPGAAIEGVDVALVREAAASLGLGVEFVPTTWKMLLEDARAGRFDVAVGGVGITPERRREMSFTRAWARDYKTPLVRCGEESRYLSRAQINRADVRVVVNPGGTNERFARTTFPAAQLSVHADNLGVFDEVAAGRADVFVTDGVEAQLQARLHPGLCVVNGTSDWLPADKGMLVVDKDTRRAMEAAIAAALRRQPYATRLNDWLAYDWRAANPPEAVRELARLIDERLVIVIEVARWKWNHHAAIEDPPREASLMAAQLAAAERLGVPASRVEAFFSAQITAARQLQHDLFALWERQRAGAFNGVADLDRDLRPRIDAINSRMLTALARWDGRSLPVAQLGPLDLGQLSPQARQVGLSPLVTVGTPGGPQ
jgi:chorismate mutase-like protein